MRRLIYLAPLLVIGCQSALTGNEGNFQFSYTADDNINDFNKPVAVGAFLDIKVTGVGTFSPVELTAASYDDPTVLDVLEFSGNGLTVQGMGEGLALLEVAGDLDGAALTDSVNMQSKVPEVLKLWHTCTLGADAAYLVERDVVVGFEMEMSNSQPVIGYGYYPVSLGGTDASVLSGNQSQIWVAVNTGTTTEVVAMNSDIDGTALSMQVVTEADIDGIEAPTAFVIEDIDVGDTNSFFVRPMTGDLVVCQSDLAVSVTSDTPANCTTGAHDPDGDGEHETGWFSVTGVAAGTCQYTVTYPGADGGAGVSVQFEYTIEP